MIVAYAFVGPLPSYTIDTIYQLRLFYKGPVYFILNDLENPIVKQLEQDYQVTIVPYHTVVDSHFNYIVNSLAHKFCIVESLKGREKLFIYAFERFFLLYNCMAQYNLSNVFFAELDNLLYDDPTNWESRLATKDMAFMFDNYDRGASGVCFLRSPTLLRTFLDDCLGFIQNSTEFLNEMTVLYRFMTKHRDEIYIMPTHWTDPSIPELAHERFSDFESSIFDAASMGIYLGGMDPHHTNGVIQLKLKGKWSAIDYTKYTYEWKEDEEGRNIPYVLGGGKLLKINNLHIHSKRLGPLLSKPLPSA